MHTVAPSFIREILSAASQPDVLSLAGGLPREDLFPLDAFRSAFERACAHTGKRVLQYAETPGDRDLRAWIADRMTREHGVPSTVDNILVVTGSQQAIDLAAKLFSDGPVAFENPGYLGAMSAFRANRVPLVPVPVKAGGPDGSALRDAAAAGAQLFYGMSRYQNPAGGSYSEESVHHLADHLERYGQWFLEDDPYGDLGFDVDGAAPARRSPLVAARTPERVIYCGSFSKSVAPSLRLGFVRASEEIVTELGRLKQAADLHSSGLLQRALYVMLTDGRFDLDVHLREIRERYREQRDALVAALKRHMRDAELAAVPSGGMFLWVRVAESTSELFNRAIRDGVAFVPGRHFYLPPHGSVADDSGTGDKVDRGTLVDNTSVDGMPDDGIPDDGMRLNFSNLTAEELDRAVERLAASRRQGSAGDADGKAVGTGATSSGHTVSAGPPSR